MNRATFQRVAAATAVVCDEVKGSVGILVLMKALYLADRQFLSDFGATITGDTYASMRNGPILSGTYNLCWSCLPQADLQAEWSEAFTKHGHLVSKRGKVDTDFLAPAEEDALREATRFVTKLDSERKLVKWMHENCPEWEEPNPRGPQSTKLPIQRIAEVGLKRSHEEARRIGEASAYAVKVREKSSTIERRIITAA